MDEDELGECSVDLQEIDDAIPYLLDFLVAGVMEQLLIVSDDVIEA